MNARNPVPLSGERLGYRIDEAARLLGVSRNTIYRRIADGVLKTSGALGVTIVSAESIKALFEPHLTGRR